MKEFTIGFTGTQDGMTEKQLIALVYLLSQFDFATKYRHGDCIGADEQFHNVLERIGCKDLVEIHPCTIENKRAFCGAPIVHKPKAPLVRNHDIVDNSDLLIATPKENTEQLRSGTWATYRYAIKTGKRVIKIQPNGIYRKISHLRS